MTGAAPAGAAPALAATLLPVAVHADPPDEIRPYSTTPLLQRQHPAHAAADVGDLPAIATIGVAW
ncbi:hypothetical protein [Nocardia huaxiensis]|uniref:hypothetical protein n=1 Tax=Nocardia huaxiensis TaxID=2755382 RepID=UPI001E57C929|nr:hypothetical protein [Nocardia huaxiensis]UFS98428.1 hypothetical protein LPY97_11255 [Nocardia huaxiensis]